MAPFTNEFCIIHIHFFLCDSYDMRFSSFGRISLFADHSNASCFLFFFFSLKLLLNVIVCFVLGWVFSFFFISFFIWAWRQKRCERHCNSFAMNNKGWHEQQQQNEQKMNLNPITSRQPIFISHFVKSQATREI